MKTPAIISALTVVGSIAFAAGQSQTVRVTPVDEKPMEGDEPPVMAMGAGSCDFDLLPQEVWFSPNLRAISNCDNGSTVNYLFPDWVYRLSAVDVNADGSTDYFFTLPFVGNGGSTSIGIPVIASGQATTGAMLIRGELALSGQSSTESLTCVLRTELVGEAILRAFPGPIQSGVSVTFLRWRDMDSDGDLDLVFQVSINLPPPFGNLVWLENIGYEKPDPPVAADLNQDGAVNGEDLGLLLAAWTIP